jgi:hypothetical protein
MIDRLCSSNGREDADGHKHLPQNDRHELQSLESSRSAQVR